MAKHLALIVAMLFIPALAKADSFVSVNMLPEVFHVAGEETVGATFIWDTTTNQLSDITLTATGEFWQGTDPATLVGPRGGGNIAGTLSLGFLNFMNAEGDVFQLNYGIHEDVRPILTSVPYQGHMPPTYGCGVPSAPHMALATSMARILA
jgi:hypothetical protein